jgi:hypothetical protein
MTDIIQWARLDDLSATVSALAWPSPSFMYLERVPDRWLSQEERERGLRLEMLDLEAAFNAWERGRVFCEAFELRWEKLDGAFQTVYVGPAADLPGFAPADELDLSAVKVRERSYDLWGNRVPDDQLETVGAPTGTDLAVFLEFKIPRLLLYPVSEEARRVRLRACEYLDPSDGTLCYYRFEKLEEA